MILVVALCLIHIVSAGYVPGEVSVTAPACNNGTTIPNSDRTSQHPCTGRLGDTCEYTCDPGYMPIGRHVCQDYAVHKEVFLHETFFGGRCQRLCSPSTCPNGHYPMRVNASDGEGPCYATKCFSNSQDALRHIAKGSWELWRRGYSNRYLCKADSDRTGQYSDHVDVIGGQTTCDGAASGVTGLGMIMECVAASLGYQTREEAQSRVQLTLRSLAGHTPGFKIARDLRGFFAHFYDCNAGSTKTPDTSCLMCTGLMMAGARFVKNYFSQLDPSLPETKQIVGFVDELWESTKFEDILCDNGHVASNGTGIPMVQSMNSTQCGVIQEPKDDGYYQFNEEHYTVWYAYLKACGNSTKGNCPNKAIENMWNAWQGRRFHPNHAYKQYDLLSMWSGYLVQLPYYATNSFNNDTTYQELFRSHWLADWAYYNDTTYAGEHGRYGLGAGPTPAWCTEGSKYSADQINGGSSHCRMISPYVIAGYMPNNPPLIQQQLLDIMASGDEVLAIPGTDLHVLWRRSMLDPTWVQGYGVTMVDFSGELLGLATLWLEEDFFQRFSV